MSMTRTGFRNVTLITMVGIILAAVVVFQIAQKKRIEIDQLSMELTAQQEELDNASRLSAALAELDKLTIDETTATQLNILRHLGLEGNDYDFRIASKQTKQIGETNLILRDVSLKASLPYASALNLADRMYNTKKMVINHVALSPANRGEGALEPESISIEIGGTIYGLEKKGVSQ